MTLRQPLLLFPIGEEGETDMKIEVESNGEDACVIQTLKQQDLDDAYESLLQYLIAVAFLHCPHYASRWWYKHHRRAQGKRQGNLAESEKNIIR